MCSPPQIFNEASDVWSFGVAQWEMMTYGDTPYHGENIEIAKIPDYVIDGGRLRFPPVRRTKYACISDRMQFNKFVDVAQSSGEDTWTAWCDIVKSCWEDDADDRPRFEGLSASLGLLLGECSGAAPARDVGRLLQETRGNKSTAF